MSDERMDQRLREYAGRWRAAQPGPAAPSVRRRRERWLPAAVAACVVALVGGVGVAVVRDDTGVTPQPPLSAGPTPYVRPCGEEDVQGTVAFKEDGADLAGQLDLTSDEPCRIEPGIKVGIRGTNMRDLGVEFVLRGEDKAHVLTPTDPAVLSLRWRAPFCQPRQLVLVLLVEIDKVVAFRLPLDPARTPECTPTDGVGVSRLEAVWLPASEETCDVEDFAVEHATGQRDALRQVLFDVVLRNVSDKFCDIDLKPLVVITAQGGRVPRMSHVTTQEGRLSPGLPPGATASAQLSWSYYCGTALGEYSVDIRLVGAKSLRLPLTDHPVPPCVEERRNPREEGQTSSGWLTPKDVPRRD